MFKECDFFCELLSFSHFCVFMQLFYCYILFYKTFTYFIEMKSKTVEDYFHTFSARNWMKFARVVICPELYNMADSRSLHLSNF